MKLKLLLLASVICFAGCKNSDETVPQCALVSCTSFQLSLNLRYVDKNTNASLLGTSSASYKLADLKLARVSNPDYKPLTKISETDNSVIVINEVLNGDLLTLGNLIADKITYTTKGSKTECCRVDITSLKINEVTICAPCTDLDKRVLIIKK